MEGILYSVQYVAPKGNSKLLGDYGRLTSAHTVVDSLVSRSLRKYKRQMIGKPDIERIQKKDGVHTFLRMTIKAHQFGTRLIVRHFVVIEKPIKTYQVNDVEEIHA